MLRDDKENGFQNNGSCFDSNWPSPSFPGPLFSNEVKCSAFDMEMIFQSHANKTHFRKKGCTPSLNLKMRVFGTPKWPITVNHKS